METTKF